MLLRTDINLPIEDGEPQKTVRFKRYMETVRELSEKGAKTVVVAHQGRPNRNDFRSLETHAELMSDSLGKDVDFVPSFFGSELEETIEKMENGSVALLENVRFLSEELQNVPPETHSEDIFVERTAPLFDLYVNDAFSAAHRSHSSLVGFTQKLDSYPGPVMKQELEACGKVRDELESPLLVLGGEKPSDIIGVLEEMIEDAEKVLLGGVPGELGLIVKGNDLGEKKDWIEEKGLSAKADELEKLLSENREKIVLPQDLETESGDYKSSNIPEDEMTWDIGEKTRREFVGEIRNADSVLMKGPMGAFDQGHEKGSRAVVDSMAETEAYTVLGGGHTSSLIQRFDHEIEDFDHVSIAGGAFVRFMSGEELVAVEALRK